MLEAELVDLAREIAAFKSEKQTLEVKSAREGCPRRLYDSLSSFSNQDDGGVIVFGIDEQHGYEICGVYDAQDLQKHVVEQCNQMSPEVRAVFTTASIDGKTVVSAEIPGMDAAERPCFYRGKGRIKGSYVRVGESDEPMTEYEVYSYEAFKRKYEDEIRTVERATRASLNEDLLEEFLARLKSGKPNLSRVNDSSICELMSVTRGGTPTVAGVLLFSLYPQAFFPQLAVVATVVPGLAVGEVGKAGERFVDNKRIEGTLFDQIDASLQFVRANMKTKTVINAETGRREDVPDYPIEAVRELILNAIIHRDYSLHTEGMPIQIQMFSDRLEITNPGGLYGRLTIDQLGKVQPDTRNPVIATAMEVMAETENRYSGIPTVRRLARENGLPAPEFIDARGEFKVILRKAVDGAESVGAHSNVGLEMRAVKGENADVGRIAALMRGRYAEVLSFCSEFRSRNEISEYLDVGVDYASRKYIRPLVDAGLLELEKTGSPRSHGQRYRYVEGAGC